MGEGKINTIKYIVATNLVRPVRSLVPDSILWAGFGFAVLIGALIVTSLAVSNVIAPQGTIRIAMAKPVAVHRTIHQTEVARFGTKVSEAFGIRKHVAHEFADWILEAAERQDITPELLASLVVTESSFRKNVTSHVGAIGPAQVRPDYWSKFCGTKDLADPEQNIYCGAQILRYLLERCDNDRACALAAYNVGPYSSKHSAAKRYVAKIDRYLNSLENSAL